MTAVTRMASRAWLIAAMSVCAAANGTAATPAAGTHHLAVVVNDFCAVDPGTLADAERVMSDVYRRAGIEIAWVDPGIMAEPDTLYVNVLSSDMADEFSTSKETVGYATPGSLAATVIYDRVRHAARSRSLRPGLLLGYVMAHELGHLLLPAHSHSVTGVMRASIDVEQAADRKLRFTSDQAALMIERLTMATMATKTN